MKLAAGWVSPREYYLPRWLFSWGWWGPVAQIRVLGFYLTISRSQ